jgi:predicted AAA+ superfamily ATPase
MRQVTFPRWLKKTLTDSLASVPAVFVNGPRQAGKSTLVRTLFDGGALPPSYITFDDVSARAGAANDPLAFLRQFDRPVILDEVQLVPALFRALKQVIDEMRLHDRQAAAGRFLLTGSANIMALPELADALVGRVRVLNLLPLSMGEYAHKPRALEKFLEDRLPFDNGQAFAPFALEEWLHRATFPEVALMPPPDRPWWYQDYITTMLQRDVRQLSEIDKLFALPHLLKVLALRAGSLVNDSAAARDAGLNTMTYRRYRSLLENVFMITTLPPWFRSAGKRLAKAPKLFFYDTGLLAHLLDAAPVVLQASGSPLYGHLVENFVATELMKQCTLSPRTRLYHFRTEAGKEVDFVLEGEGGRLIGIEVKARASVTSQDFQGLKAFAALSQPDFHRGIVLYTGTQVLSFGETLTAVPITALMG